MKRKILLFFMLIAAFFALIVAPNNTDNSNNLIDIKEAEAADVTTNMVLFLDLDWHTSNSTNWTQGNARFAMYFWNGSKNAWSSMVRIGSSNVYYAQVPSGTWTNFKFVRMNPSTTANNWNNKYNESASFSFDGTNNYFKLWTDSWDNSGATQTKVTTSKIYFSTNDSWSNYYANFKIVSDSEKWMNLQMIKDDSQTYRGKNVYYIDVPLIYDGYYYLEFHNGDFSKKKDPGFLNSNDADHWEMGADISGYLYYYGVSGDSGYSGWKSKVTTTLHYNNGSANGTVTKYDGDTYTMPTPTKANAAFIGWYDKENVSISDTKYTSITISSSKKNYYAIWADYTEIYFLTNKKYTDSDGLEHTDYVYQYFNVISDVYIGAPGVSETNKFTNKGYTAAGFKYRDKDVYKVILPIANIQGATYTFVIDAAPTKEGSRPNRIEIPDIPVTDIKAGNLYFYNASYNGTTNTILSGWKNKVDIYLDYNDNADEASQTIQKISNLYEDDFYYADINPTWNRHRFLGWCNEEKLSSTKYSYYDNANGKGYRLVVKKDQTYYGLWAEYYTLYFATNRTANLTSGDNQEYVPYYSTIQSSLFGADPVSVDGFGDYGSLYLGKYKIYTMQLPVVMSKYLKDDADKAAEGDYIVRINVNNSSSSNDSRIEISSVNGDVIRNGELYYYDAEGKITGWKQKVVITFHFNDGKNTTSQVTRFEGEEAETPKVEDKDVDSDGKIDACVGWSSQLNQITNPVGTSTFVVSKDTPNYYAIWATYHTFYFATNAIIDNTTEGLNNVTYNPIYATIFHSSLGDIPIDGSIDPYAGSSTQLYNGAQIYTVILPLLKGLTDTTYDLRFNVAEIEATAGNRNPYRIFIKDVHSSLLVNNDLSNTLNLIYYNVPGEHYDYDDAVSNKNTATWHEKTITNIYDKGALVHVIHSWEGNTVDLPEEIIPDGDKTQDTFFNGWYKSYNGLTYGSNTESSKYVVTYNGDYQAYYASYFTAGDKIYLIMPNDWETYENVGVYLWGEGDALFDATLISNPDDIEYKVYVATIPGTAGSKSLYYGMMFINTTGSVSAYTSKNVWPIVQHRTSDFTATSYNGYDISVNATIFNSGYEYHGSWVDVGCLTVNDIDGQGNSFVVAYHVGYEVKSIPLTSQKNKYFYGWLDSLGQPTDALTLPYVLKHGNESYSIEWKDASQYVTSTFDVKYKEAKVSENVYGVVPIYAKLEFTIGDSLPLSGAYYVLYIDGIEYGTYTSYEALKTAFDAQNSKIEYNPIVSNKIKTTTSEWDAHHSVAIIITDAYGAELFNSYEDTVMVGDQAEPLTAHNFINRYIYDQVHDSAFTFDLFNDNEDKAMYQLHKHAFGDAVAIEDQYINDAMHLYKNCKICGYNEQEYDDKTGKAVTVSWSVSGGVYTYTATFQLANTDENGNVLSYSTYTYTKQYNEQINYMFKKDEVKNTEDTRPIAYAAITKDGNVINEFASLYDAIEMCYKHDGDDINNFNGYGYGSYVVKITDGEYGEEKMFVNKQEFSGGDSNDMYWFYQGGSSLQRYTHFVTNYWTSILNNTKYTSIQRSADESSKGAGLYSYANSYKVFAANTRDYTNTYEHCFEQESSVQIVLQNGCVIDKVYYYFDEVSFSVNLSETKIYPSYQGADKAWVYIGFTVFDKDLVTQHGIKCDTTTGNWYYYSGIISNSHDGTETTELIITNESDVCILTSAWNAAGGYFTPNADVNIKVSLGAVTYDTTKDRTEIVTKTVGDVLKTYKNCYRTFYKTNEVEITFDDNMNGAFDTTNKAGDRTYVYAKTYAAETLNSVEVTDPSNPDKTAAAYAEAEVSHARIILGLDIESSSEQTSDYMCGAQFKGAYITSSSAKDTAKDKEIFDIHNIYKASYVDGVLKGSYIVNSINVNSVAYNNAVVTVDNLTLIDSSNSVMGNYTQSGNDYYISPIYNFSYTTINSSSDALASTIVKVQEIVMDAYKYEVIVENDFFDYQYNSNKYGADGKEVSYTEFAAAVDKAEFYYESLSDSEITVLEVSYPSGTSADDFTNIYQQYVLELQEDIRNLQKFKYGAFGSVVTNGKEISKNIGGQISYNTKTDTYSLLISLPLWGRVELYYNGKTLTTDTNDDMTNKELMDVSGLFTNKCAPPWTQSLYTSGTKTETKEDGTKVTTKNYSALITSKLRGASYVFEFSPYSTVATNGAVGALTIKQSTYSPLEYVGDYIDTNGTTGAIVSKTDRFTYEYYGFKLSTDEKVGYHDPSDVQTVTMGKVSYDEVRGVYMLTQSLADWRGVVLKYDGVTITSSNTEIRGLFHTNSYAGPHMYHFGEKGGLMNPGPTMVYTFIYDPLNNRLFIMPSEYASIQTTYDEVYLTNAASTVGAVTHWSAGTVLHDYDKSWYTITKADGKTTVTANGWRLYVVVNSEGKIVYCVNNPVDGFGGYEKPSYYAHPDYKDYLTNTNANGGAFNFRKDANGNITAWEIKVPVGGFALTAYGDGAKSGDAMDVLAEYLTNYSATKTTNLVGGQEELWNHKNVIDEGVRLYKTYDSSTKTYTITFSYVPDSSNIHRVDM